MDSLITFIKTAQVMSESKSDTYAEVVMIGDEGTWCAAIRKSISGADITRGFGRDANDACASALENIPDRK